MAKKRVVKNNKKVIAWTIILILIVLGLFLFIKYKNNYGMAPVNTTISTTGNVIIDIELEKQEPRLVKWFKGLFNLGTERDNILINQP